MFAAAPGINLSAAPSCRRYGIRYTLRASAAGMNDDGTDGATGAPEDPSGPLGNVTQEQLAHRVGVSWSTVSRWENGRGKPSPLAREKLAKVLWATGLADRVADLTEGS